MSGSSKRDPLVERLLGPAPYPHETATIGLAETHISWVLLTGDYAYKIKKPLKLPFLDFSTLDKRKHFCTEELRLNRRLAPEIYLDVVPIGGKRTAPRIGTTPAIEWALKMVQFPPDRLGSDVLASKTVPPEAFEKLAEALGKFHEELPPTRGSEVSATVIGNIRELEDGIGADALQTIRAWTQRETIRIEQLLQDRETGGSIRECHGDLHLKNLVLIDNRFVAFDCLEFDRILRCIDVINDVAFLAMDLMAHDRDDLAFEFLNRYLQFTGDYAALRLLRYYLVYRALVRAKVRVIEAKQNQDGPKCRRAPYIDLASRLIDAPKPLLIVTKGLSGSGKTTLTDELIGRLPAIRVRSDVERKRLSGLGALESSHSGVGRDLYSEAMGAATYEALGAAAGDGLSAGINMIIDATFLKRHERDRFRAIAGEHGARFVILDCEAREAILRQRIRGRSSSANDASEAGLDVLDYQISRNEPVAPGERACAVTVNSGEYVDIAALSADLAKIGRDG
jgi:aminoglycoside phosphotransferase family enzyme/predicted kinase